MAGDPETRSAPVAVSERLELFRAAGVFELAQGSGFLLPDPFSGDLELLSDLFEGVLVSIAQSKTHLEDLGFPFGQGFLGEEESPGFWHLHVARL